MSNSILTTVKKLSGIEAEYDHFDTDLVIFINTTFMTLNQLGVGPEEGYSISGVEETWEDYLKEQKNLEAVKTYVSLQAKLFFDPPSSSALIEAMERQIAQIEWRLSVQAGTGV